MIALLTHEKQKLAFFIEQSRERQAEIIRESYLDSDISGQLIRAYELIFNNIK